MKHYERVCAYIDLDAILHNMDCMKKNIAKDTKIVAVIKTDGYGHGAVRIAKELEDIPYVWGYAVATAEEALIDRSAYHGCAWLCDAGSGRRKVSEFQSRAA